jgi:hypothetical protein
MILRRRMTKTRPRGCGIMQQCVRPPPPRLQKKISTIIIVSEKDTFFFSSSTMSQKKTTLRYTTTVLPPCVGAFTRDSQRRHNKRWSAQVVPLVKVFATVGEQSIPHSARGCGRLFARAQAPVSIHCRARIPRTGCIKKRAYQRRRNSQSPNNFFLQD